MAILTVPYLVFSGGAQRADRVHGFCGDMAFILPMIKRGRS